MRGEVPRTSRKNAKYFYRYCCMLILTTIASALFFKQWYDFVAEHNQTGALLGWGNLGMSLGIYIVLFFIISRWMHAFKIGVERKANLLAGQMLALFVVDIIEIFVSCAITGQFRFFLDFTWIYFGMFCIQTLISCILIILMTNLYRRIFPPLRLLEICGDYKNDLVKKINGVHYKYKVEDTVYYKTDIDELCEKIQEFDAVLINDVPAKYQHKLIKLCFEEAIRVYFVPKISDILVKQSQEINLIDSPLFLNKNNGISPFQRFVKRFFDIVLSMVALVILSPFLLITALAIHFEDKGPVFFRQERVTVGGKHFQIIKFRSMIVDAEKDGKPHPAGEKDDRITKVGRIIRAIRVDELPQLFNILKGDMSIVGPRPERWEHMELYSKDIEEFELRCKMKGGLTGYAQVYGKYNTTALDKLKLDLLYITNYSLLLDLQIIFETIKILVHKESTEGFSESESKKMHDTFDLERNE